jgi:hypothetical protein
MWMWIAIAAQVLTCAIALGFLWKDWKELADRHRLLPSGLLVATLIATGLSIALVAKGVRDADRQEADAQRQESLHKGETQQFRSTLGTLLDRMGALQKQVNTEPLLQQNQKLQQDIADAKKLIQSTKDQLDKPAPKAVLEAMFAKTMEDIATKNKEITVAPQRDGSVEFTILVVNTSSVQAKNGLILVRVCRDCTFANEPERSTKPVGAPDSDRERLFDTLSAGISLAIPLKIMPPQHVSKLEVDVNVRCENCEVRPKDSLFVNF